MTATDMQKERMADERMYEHKKMIKKQQMVE